MEGFGLAAAKQVDLALFQAWHTEAFAREKRLKPLSKYTSKPSQRQGPEEMLATLRELKARGADMEIRRVS